MGTDSEMEMEMEWTAAVMGQMPVDETSSRRRRRVLKELEGKGRGSLEQTSEPRLWMIMNTSTFV